MKTYKSNYNKIKWYKEIDWLRLIISYILIAVLITVVFNYLGKDLNRAISTSLLITTLIAVELVISDLYNNKTIILMEDKNTLTYIDLRNGIDGNLITFDEYETIISDHSPKEIYDNIEKYEGIDRGLIKEILKIKKRINRIVVTANVEEKYWKAYGSFKINKVVLKEKEHKKKLIIKNSFQNYEEVYKLLSKKCR